MIKLINRIIKASGAKPFDAAMTADRITAAILDDVTARRGWRQEWEQMDADVQAEIVLEWRRIIAAELTQ